MASRFFACSSIVVFLVLGEALPALAAQGGLTSAQLHDLRAIPFAVVPGRVPTGYHVKKISIDRPAQKYSIDYVGPHGAQIRISGVTAQGDVKEASGPPKRRHGIFQQIGSAFTNLSHNAKDLSLRSENEKANKSAGDNSETGGEEEEEMTSLSADSNLLGPVFFQNKSDCLNGNPDRSRAQIRTAQFTVTGCNLKVPDPLVQFYRNLERVQP